MIHRFDFSPLFRGRFRRIALAGTALLLVGLICLNFGGPATQAAGAPTTQPPIDPECIEAIRTLKKITKPSDKDAREKVYDIVARKGDSRLIPVIQAYKDGLLLFRGDHFATLGERVKTNRNGQETTVQPVVDIFTGERLNGPDGKPEFMDKIRGATGVAYKERPVVEELLSVMKLLDPRPKVRLNSIREVTERAAIAYIDVSEQRRFATALVQAKAAITANKLRDPFTPLVMNLRTAIDAALADKPSKPIVPVPGKDVSDTAISDLKTLREAIDPAAKEDETAPVRPGTIADPTPAEAVLMEELRQAWNAANDYGDRLDKQMKLLAVLPRYAAAVNGQYERDPNGPFADALREAIAGTDAVLGSHDAQVKAAAVLGDAGTSRAANILQRLLDSAHQAGDTSLEQAAAPALAKAQSRQAKIQFVQNTFYGLSAGSILVLLALGLSIIFGLMGVINMAHGEFMMLGAFTTLVVYEAFKRFAPNYLEYYLIVAIPAAFLVAGLVGYVCEYLVIRHLYGRPLETLLATFGVGMVLIWCVRRLFGDNVTVSPPKWMLGNVELVPDLTFQLGRIYIIVYCMICIAVVYYIVNRTKLGLLLRATTQNREMAAALGVATRRVDGVTFAIGTGLAGLAGVAVPLYNKINPQVGQEYVVDCFMVVVVGGVGKLAGAIWAGLGLGFISKYLEPILSNIKALAEGSSVFARVLVLAMIVVFLQFRPSGLFPPKGRNADA